MAQQQIAAVSGVSGLTGTTGVQAPGAFLPSTASARAAGIPGLPSPVASTGSDQVQFSQALADEQGLATTAGTQPTQDPQKTAEQKAAEEQKAKEEEARKAEEEKAKELEDLSAQMQQALLAGDQQKAQTLLQKIQALLGSNADAGTIGDTNNGAQDQVNQVASANDGAGQAAGNYAPSGNYQSPGGGAVNGGGGAAVQDNSAAGYIEGEVKPPSGTIVQPLDNLRVTSEFGPRWGKQHNGIDFGAAQGTPVKSVMDGTVTRVANDPGGYGNWVEVKHADGSTSRYAHLSAFGKIKVGQDIGAGTVIGAVGSTGNSTGPHLHFEWRKNGTPVNPRGVFNWI